MRCIHLTKWKGTQFWSACLEVEADKFLTNSDNNHSLGFCPKDPNEEHWPIIGQSDGLPDGIQACAFRTLCKYL